jgi:hypothetical protein
VNLNDSVPIQYTARQEGPNFWRADMRIPDAFLELMDCELVAVDEDDLDYILRQLARRVLDRFLNRPKCMLN